MHKVPTCPLYGGSIVVQKYVEVILISCSHVSYTSIYDILCDKPGHTYCLLKPKNALLIGINLVMVECLSMVIIVFLLMTYGTH